jgi:hypothetical protein
MKRASMFLVILMATMLSGCSYSIDYVVVNTSGAPVQVTYTIAETTIDPLIAVGPGTPAMLPVSELSDREWRKLSEQEFGFDRGNRTVTVSLPPNQGLLIVRGRGEANPRPPNTITEIRIAGLNGEVVVRGDAIAEAFVVVPKPFYRFGPPTLWTLTYS